MASSTCPQQGCVPVLQSSKTNGHPQWTQSPETSIPARNHNCRQHSYQAPMTTTHVCRLSHCSSPSTDHSPSHLQATPPSHDGLQRMSTTGLWSRPTIKPTHTVTMNTITIDIKANTQLQLSPTQPDDCYQAKMSTTHECRLSHCSSPSMDHSPSHIQATPQSHIGLQRMPPTGLCPRSTIKQMCTTQWTQSPETSIPEIKHICRQYSSHACVQTLTLFLSVNGSQPFSHTSHSAIS